MKSKILLFTFVIFFTGSLAAQDYADTISLGWGGWGTDLSFPGSGGPALAPNDGDYETADGTEFPFSQTFQFTPNPDDPSTTDYVNVDLTISVGANYYDTDTWEIVEDSVLYYNNIGGRGIGVSTDPDPNDESSPAWVDNGDRRQFNEDEVLTVAFTEINNTPANDLYPDVQTGISGLMVWTPRSGSQTYPLVYLNGEHVAYLQTERSAGTGATNQFYRFITDPITKDSTKIVVTQGDTLQLWGAPQSYYRLYALVLVLEDTEPATGLNLSAEGGAAEITELNGSLNILGEILPETSSVELIQWSLENNDINATINTGGVVQAWPRAAGNGTVTAKGMIGDVSSTIEVTISGQYDVTVDSIYVTSWNDSITENGGTLRMEAEVFPDIAANKDVVWSVDDAGTGATIDETGLLQGGANDNGNGTVIVMATAADGSGVSDTMKVHIINQESVFVESIEITFDGDFAEILENGGTLQLNASVLPELASDKSVSWSFEGDDLGASIDENGLLTASGADDGNGVVTVKATANDGSGVSSTLVVTIANQSSVSVPLTELQKAVRVYPNPVNGNQVLVLEISENIAVLEAIRVFDITGRKVSEITNFSGNHYRTELSFNKEKGIYLIKVDTDRGSVIRRALVK